MIDFGNPVLVLGQKGVSGTDNGVFNAPDGVGTNSKGEIVVTDTGNNRIQVFSSDGRFISLFGSSGSENGQFNGVMAVTCGKQDNMYFADPYNQRIQVYDHQQKYVRTIAGNVTEQTKDGNLHGPAGMAVVENDNEEHIYVAEYMNNRVSVFNTASGKFIRNFGRKGTGTEEFNGVFSPCVSSKGEVLVGEYDNKRIQVFDKKGNHLRYIGDKGELTGPALACVDPSNDTLFVTDPDCPAEKVKVFSIETGKLLYAFGGENQEANRGKEWIQKPFGISFDVHNRRLLLADHSLHVIVVYKME